jgi:hypothetical protein
MEGAWMPRGPGLWLAFTFVSLAIVACAERQLPNSYTYVIVNACETVIANPQEEIVIPANISKYTVKKGIIVGRRENSCNLERDYMGPYGYFIVNTKTHDVKLGLSRAELREGLRAMGVEDIEL